MSELAPQAPEHQEALPEGQHEALLTATTPEASHAEQPEAEPSQYIEAASKAAETNASVDNPLERLKAAEKAEATQDKPGFVTQQDKKTTLNRKLKQVQRELPVTDRALSKVIHQKTIRAVSEASAKTLTRPSGLLGGGLLAFIGTSAYLFFTKYIGIPYNYGIFVLLFIGGFILGLLLELVVWSMTSRHRSSE